MLSRWWSTWWGKPSKPKGRWAHLMEPYHGQEVIVLDCETSIFDKKKGELLSLAAVRVNGERIYLSEALDLTIRSDVQTDPNAVRVHHLRQEDRQQGVSVSQAVEKLLDFVGNRPICGFCIDFDRAILNRYIKERYHFELPNQFIDVADIYAAQKRKVHPEMEVNLSFDVIAAELNIPIIERHTALGDVVTTALLYQSLQRRQLSR